MDARLNLINLLKQALAGHAVTTNDLSAAAPDPAALGQLERVAWQRLSQCADDDDDDIHDGDESHIDMRRSQLIESLPDLEALEAGYDSSEIAFGEYQATHVSVRGCLIVCAVMAVLLYLMFRNGFFMHGDP